MKNLLNLLCGAVLASIFCGCAFLDFGSEKTPYLQNADGVKCEILSYERHSRADYTYKLKVLSSGKIYIVNSPRYYYNGGDTAYVIVQNGVVTNMILDKRKPNSSSYNPSQNEGKIVKKMLRQNSEISVPKSENISF